MKNKLLLSVLVCTSLFAPYSDNKATPVIAEESTQETEKPETYYSLANNYFYTMRNPDYISPDSIEAWVRLPIISSGGTIFASGYSKLVSLNVDIFGHVGIRWNEIEVDYTFENSTNIADNKWHHIAMVRTNDKITYYLDGEKEDEIAVNTTKLQNDFGFNVGAGSKNSTKANNRQSLEGFVKQVTVYSGAISQEQVQKDMNDDLINSTDVLSKDTELFGSWNFKEYWTERYIQNSLDSGVRAELYSYGKMVPEDKSYDAYDYSFVIFPDIQLMTNYNEPKLNRTIQWLVDHKEERNIKFAFFDGDLSDFGQKEELYQRAANAMSRLDNQVPYCFAPGNHDYDDNAKTRSQVYFNRHFPQSKHSQLPGFGGVFEEGSMANSYYKFEISEDIKYLVINLEYMPRKSVLRWANVIAEAHPDYRVIMNTHSYMNSDAFFASASTVGNESNGGKDIFNNFMVNNSNIFMGIGGHTGSDDVLQRFDYGKNGNRIVSMLIDLQSSSYQGDIWIDPFVLVQVNESKKSMMFMYYSPEHESVYNVQNQFEISFADANNPAIGA